MYSQIFSLAMSKPIAPILSNIRHIMYTLESHVLQTVPSHILYHVIYYVNDIILILPEIKISNVFQNFNYFHDRLNFTLEEPISNLFKFLDNMISLIDNTAVTNWFRKGLGLRHPSQE